MDTMEIDDNVYINKNLIHEGNFQKKKRLHRCVTLCLVLLCAVLLAGNILQVIFSEQMRHFLSRNATQASFDTLSQTKEHLQNSDALITERDSLQSKNEALTVEKTQLEIMQENLTKEKNQLQQSYNSLIAQRNDLEAKFKHLTREREDLQVTYDTLRIESDKLRINSSDIQRSLEELQTTQRELTASKSQLQNECDDLLKEKNDLDTVYMALKIKSDLLEKNHNSASSEKDQLQRAYNTLRGEKEQLQTRYHNLSMSRDQLQKGLDKMNKKLKAMPCKENWVKFDLSCYFVSTEKKNWTESRQECIAQGGDLVILDSIEEQAFINGQLSNGINVWIGLSDHGEEGTWMWVDGTPVTKTYWSPGQPNSYEGNQDCGEFVHSAQGVGENWNDDGCFSSQHSICEL